jgi:hypothetical protein
MCRLAAFREHTLAPRGALLDLGPMRESLPRRRPATRRTRNRVILRVGIVVPDRAQSASVQLLFLWADRVTFSNKMTRIPR